MVDSSHPESRDDELSTAANAVCILMPAFWLFSFSPQFQRIATAAESI